MRQQGLEGFLTANFDGDANMRKGRLARAAPALLSEAVVGDPVRSPAGGARRDDAPLVSDGLEFHGGAGCEFALAYTHTLI